MLAKITRIKSLLVLLFFLSHNLTTFTQSNRSYVIFITSYNNIKWWKQNIKSALYQKGAPYRVLFVDDCSTDGTGQAVEDYIKNWKQRTRSQLDVTIIRNAVRGGALSNWYRAIHTCEDHEIIVSLDGDDWLAHDHVLLRLEAEYTKGCWMTYGHWIKQPGGFQGQTRPLKADFSVRKQPFVSSHLRTFYAGLFNQIKLKDLLDNNNKFYPMAWDVALMLPMLEMCNGRYAFIPDILYIYNGSNPISDNAINEAFQTRLASQIQNKRSYASIQAYKTNFMKNLNYLIIDVTNFQQKFIEFYAEPYLVESYIVVNLSGGLEPNNFPEAFRLLQQTGLDALVVGNDTEIIINSELVSSLSAKNSAKNSETKDIYAIQAKNLTVDNTKYVILSREIYLKILKKIGLYDSNLDNFAQLYEPIINELIQQNDLILYTAVSTGKNS